MNGTMKYKPLSNTGLKLSVIGLGTMNFGQQVDETEAHEQLDYAVGHGVNFIDTAEMYPVPPEKEKQGDTEVMVGNWIEKSGKRNDFYLATKVSSRNQAGPLRTRDATGGLTKRNILEAIDGSLARLKTDHVELYQVHTPDRHTNFFGKRGVESLDGDDGVSIEETLDGLNEVVKSGKAKYIGVSNETPWGIMEYLRIAKERNYPRIVSIQNNFSLLARTFEIGLSEMCLRENISLLPYSSTNRGVLAGKYLGGAQPAGARFTRWDRDRNRYNPAHAQDAIQAYIDLAKKHSIDPVVLSMAFAASRPYVSSNIIGATSMDQLKMDLTAGDIDISPELESDIAALYAVMPDPTC